MNRKKTFALLLMLALIVGILPAASAADPLADGYYMIGPEWSVDDIIADSLFRVNPANAEEYMLNTSLEEGQRFKVVRVEGGEIADWYPGGEGNEYVVPDYLSGDVRIYFRTVWQNNWGNFYNVVKRYPITAAAVNCTVSLSEESAPKEDTVTITLTGNTGYVFSTLEIRKEDGGSVGYSGGDGQYSFSMPDGPVTVSAVFAKQIDDGFYLIGPEWSVDDINASQVFVPNSVTNREYYLTSITLDEGQHFKIVRIASSAIQSWYPQGRDYVVDEAHSGERIIYFRPDGKPDGSWIVHESQTGNYFYVASRQDILTDNAYYLIGPDWEASDIDRNEIFHDNPALEGEYILMTNRSAGQLIKVARTGLNGAITDWYPDIYGGEYSVTSDESGDIVVYFRPTYNDAWARYSGYFYIAAPCYIKVDQADHGTVSADSDFAEQSREEAHEGELFTFSGDSTVTLTAVPDEGYALVSFSITPESGYEALSTDLEKNQAVFTIKESVAVSAVFAPVDYTVTCQTPTNGTLSSDKDKAKKGETVALTVTPDENYVIDEVSYTPEGGDTVVLDPAVSGSKSSDRSADAPAAVEYRFVMPAADVTVRASFTEIPPEPTPETSPEPTPETSPEPTPETSPGSMPETSPEPTPVTSPGSTPETSPEPTPETSPEPTPVTSPGSTPETSPEPTPVTSPGSAPETTSPEPPPVTSPGSMPETSPEPTPVTSPGSTPETSPEPTPETGSETAPEPPPTPKNVPGPTPIPTLKPTPPPGTDPETTPVSEPTDTPGSGQETTPEPTSTPENGSETTPTPVSEPTATPGSAPETTSEPTSTPEGSPVPTPEISSEPEQTSDPQNEQGPMPVSDTTPETGDEAHLSVWCAVLGICALALAAAYICAMRRRRG